MESKSERRPDVDARTVGSNACEEDKTETSYRRKWQARATHDGCIVVIKSLLSLPSVPGPEYFDSG